MNRKEKWAEFDAHYETWSKRDDAPAFVQEEIQGSWRIQVLIRPDPPQTGWLRRLLCDPPELFKAEPWYNGWPWDERGWMSFPSAERARDFYQLSTGLISFEEYRARPCPPYSGRHIDLDEHGNFVTAEEEAPNAPE